MANKKSQPKNEEEVLEGRSWKTLGFLVLFFILFAASAVGYALSQQSLLLFPMTAFGICTLIFLFLFVVNLGKEIKVEKEHNKKVEDAQKEEDKKVN